MDSVRTFSPFEIGLALAFAIVMEVGFFVVMAVAHNTAIITAAEEAMPKEVPIEVKPVLDLPLLKKGSKQVKAKLPDMWVKKPPVKRFENVTAPSTKADKTPEKLPDPKTPLAKPDAALPPPDARLAKKVDDIPEDEETEEPNLNEEGDPGGVEEGTEADPLKAFAVSQYRMKIIGWFASRFKAPDGVPCEELASLRASVAANIGASRQVAGYSITSPSGNATFDAKVRATMDSIVAGGAQLPPPPPNYPDILESTVFPVFLGKNSPQCAN